jgi:hypothetical protein
VDGELCGGGGVGDRVSRPVGAQERVDGVPSPLGWAKELRAFGPAELGWNPFGIQNAVQVSLNYEEQDIL